MTVKSISRRISDSVLMIDRLTSLPWVVDVRRRFSICLSLEKERSALQLVTIKTKYILSAIATLGKVSCTPLSIISLYKNSWVLMFLVHRLWIYQQTWQSGIARQQMNCRDHLGTYQQVSWQLLVAFLRIMLTEACRRWSSEAMNWSMKLASRADACLTHTCIRTKWQFRIQLSWARNKIWRVCMVGGSVGGRPGALAPLKSGPAFTSSFVGCKKCKW